MGISSLGSAPISINNPSEYIITYCYDERGYLKLSESQSNKILHKRLDALIDGDNNRYEYENGHDINSGIIIKSRCNHYLLVIDKKPTHISDLVFEYSEKNLVVNINLLLNKILNLHS